LGLTSFSVNFKLSSTTSEITKALTVFSYSILIEHSKQSSVFTRLTTTSFSSLMNSFSRNTTSTSSISSAYSSIHSYPASSSLISCGYACVNSLFVIKFMRFYRVF
jgi:hypothetical protein